MKVDLEAIIQKAGDEAFASDGYDPDPYLSARTAAEGTRDAIIAALRSDDCYYEVADASQTWWTAITKATDWLKERCA